jgi:hypothetical protein
MLSIAIMTLFAACSADRSTTAAMSPDGAPRIQHDGVLVCTPESFTKRIAASQRQQLTDTTSVRQAIAILGPGYIPPGSGSDSIQWFFDDGVCLQTFRWPENLDARFRPRVTTMPPTSSSGQFPTPIDDEAGRQQLDPQLTSGD